LLAETTSSVMPGRSLLVKVVVAPPEHTLYTRVGNLFGRLCVLVAAGFVVLGWIPISGKSARL